MCGGTASILVTVDGNSGLSPRVRGNLRARAYQVTGEGSIPACAGEPWDSVRTHSAPRVYPRVCGGTPLDTPSDAGLHGLSPRVRGNLVRHNRQKDWARSIPACAGEPKYPGAISSSVRVYPRVCGGTPLGTGGPVLESGLSPRVRGNLRDAVGQPVELRSIPACAGEPPSSRLLPWPAAVYPRVCGGTSTVTRPSCLARGLSPRVRGNLPHDFHVPSFPRSIPACAGEPHLTSTMTHLYKVYPRVCGGTPITPPSSKIS